MRTSRVSKETANLIHALSSTRRQTRSSLAATSSRNFNYSESSNVSTASGHIRPSVNAALEDSSSLSSANTDDIEDLLERPAKKRRRESETPPTSISSGPVKRSVSQRSSRNVAAKQETPAATVKSSKPRRQPAKRITRDDGSVDVQPPSNWESMYEIVKKMRADNPTAPVDTMGCAELHWRSSSPQDQRFQTLVALMLSSQTKDTVTAVAMQRLHTQLGPPTPVLSPKVKKEEEDAKDALVEAKDSTLTLKNILDVSPERLNELIRTVGFHNNKTKFIKAAAVILRDQYNSDIPTTADNLMKLPGVGPKMAYLCMSAAWGKHEGIGVDVHVHRITNLWAWHVTKNPEETRIALQSWLPKDKWHEINKLLVGLGQTVCLPVARRCGECDLAGKGLCKSEIKSLVFEKKRREAVTELKRGDEEQIETKIQIKEESSSLA